MDTKDQVPVILYMHAGSKNHGCEAIANSTCRILYEKWQNEHLADSLGRGYLEPLIVTNRAAEDRKYSLGGMMDAGQCTLVEEQHLAEHKAAHVIYYLWRKITNDQESFQRYRFSPLFTCIRKKEQQK